MRLHTPNRPNGLSTVVGAIASIHLHIVCYEGPCYVRADEPWTLRPGLLNPSPADEADHGTCLAKTTTHIWSLCCRRLPVQTTVTEATQATIVVTFILVMKFIVSNSRLAWLRGKAGVRMKEDFQNPNPTDADREAAERANRIVINVRQTGALL